MITRPHKNTPRAKHPLQLALTCAIGSPCFPALSSQAAENGAVPPVTPLQVQNASATLVAADYPVQPVPFTAVRITGGFWQPRQEATAPLPSPMPSSSAKTPSASRTSISLPR
jgi:hypothetical protein